MRATALAAVSVLVLAACSPGGGASTAGNGAGSSGATASGGGGFPTASNVAFRQEGTLTIGGQTIPQVSYHDGGKVRTEMKGPMGDTIMVVNNDTHEGFTLAHMMGRTIATRIDLTQQSASPVTQDQVAQWRADMANRAHQVGTCSAAGESGTEWEVAPPAGSADTSAGQRSMCVTNDGIMLQMKMNGEVVFNTTSIRRGPQDPSLFTPPAGVQFTTAHAPSQSEINDMVARAKAVAAAHGTP